MYRQWIGGVFIIVGVLLVSCGTGSNLDPNLGDSSSTTDSSSSSSDTSSSDTTDSTDNNESDSSTSSSNTSYDNSLYNSFNVGFGGSGSFEFEGNDGNVIWVNAVDFVLDDNIENNGYYQSIKLFDATQFDLLQQKLKNSKFIVFWITKAWTEEWFSAASIQEAMDAGYIPIFNYWYFGDGLSGGLPSSSQESAFYAHNVKVANFLKQLKGTKFVIMEPEFNKNIVVDVEANQYAFAAIMEKAIDTFKIHLDSETLYSICMMDTGNRGVNELNDACGYEHCALGDKHEWYKPHIVYKELADKIDFISFNQMVGQFSRDHKNPGTYYVPNPRAYSDDETGIAYLATRIDNMSKFIKEKFDKPVFMPYIAIATATWSDVNGNGAIETNEVNEEGWENQANSVFTELMESKATLLDSGLFGFAVMALFDNPRNDYEGYQYYMNNEYHLGVIKTSAIDEVDKYRLGDIAFKKDIIDAVFGK